MAHKTTACWPFKVPAEVVLESHQLRCHRD